MKDFAVEEEDGAQRLVLSGRSDITLGGEVGEKIADLRRCPLRRMVFVVEEDETAYPIQVGLLGAIGIMLEAQGIRKLVKQFFAIKG